MSLKDERLALARRALRERLAKMDREPTLLEVAVATVGVRRGAEALTSLLMWTVARRVKGGEAPTVEELAHVEVVSVGAGYKHLALLREVWGGDDGIAAMADVVEKAHGKAIGEMVRFSVGDGGSRGSGRDRASALLLVASLPALGLAL